MKQNIILALSAILAMTAVSTVQATEQDSKTQQLQEKFKAADTNGDGKLTPDEAKAMSRVSSHFDRLDKAHKGYLTLDDIEQAMGSR